MAKEMKAVIRAEVDPRGVVRGVNEVNKQLDRINKGVMQTSVATSFSAAFSVLQQTANIIMSAVRAIDRRQQEIMEMAGRFAPEAVAGRMMTEAAKVRRDVELGKTFGPELGEIEKIRQHEIRKETERLKSMGSGGLAATEDFKMFWDEIYNRVTENPSRIMGDGAVVNPNANPIRRYYDPTGDDFLSGQSLAGGRGSARGMPYESVPERQARAMEKLAKED